MFDRYFIIATAVTLLVICHPACVMAEAQPLHGDISLPMLSYTINKSGSNGGAHPSLRDIITVNYSLVLSDGTRVDSSSERGRPDAFPLNELIPAWQIILQMMKPGDDWTFYVPSEYGYGRITNKKIPANSFLIFRVELVSFVTPPAPLTR